MSYAAQRLGLPFCVALASLVLMLLPQAAPAQSQADFWISCDAPADGAANICKEAGEAIAADQGWEVSEKISLSKLDDSALLASAQEGGARALVIRLELHRSPGTEKRYAIEIIGAAQSIKRTYGMAKVSQLKDELVRLGGVVLSTAMTAPEKAEEDSEADSDEEATEEPAAEEPAAEEPADEEPAPEEPAAEEPAEDEPAEAEAVEEPAEDEAAVAEKETEEAVEEETGAAPRNRMEPDEEELAANGNQGKEDAVENEKENPGGIAGACGGSSSQRRSRQQAAIPVLLTLLALGQFVRRRAGSSQQS